VRIKVQQKVAGMVLLSAEWAVSYSQLGFTLSQLIFVRCLNTSPSTVQKWETGAKRPSGMALKLIAVVQKLGLEALT
jgi:predicted transcriptional regulator